MSEQQFALDKLYYSIMTPIEKISVGRNYITYGEVVDLLNEQQATISQLEEEKGYWKSKAMTLLMQVRRLTSRMTDKEVKEFNKELEE